MAKRKTKLEDGNLYHGSYRQLMNDKKVIEKIIKYDDDDQIETEGDGAFEVRYLKIKYDEKLMRQKTKLNKVI